MTQVLNPRYTFATFVVGAANRLAATAAHAVAESPGTAYNPLLVYGASGLGKTHLLMAIGHQARALVPTLQVEYVTLDEFVESHQAMQAAGQSDALRRRFAQLELLLLDDIQFLAGRQEIQEELLRVAEQLLTTNRQIVLATDRPPAEIQELDPRLLARFDGGLLVDIDAPDLDTRLAILGARATDRGVTFSAGVLETAAEVDVENIRELLGLLNRLVAYQSVSETPLTAAEARQLLVGEGAAASGGPASSPPSRPTAPTEAAAPSADEFADFLSDVAHTVEAQVEAWRAKVAATILRWEGEGIRTARLEEVLRRDVPSEAASVVRQFERDVERLRAAQRAMIRLDPARAEDPVFFDPDRIAEADAAVQAALREIAPPPGPSAAWTFDTLLVSEPMRVAIDAAHAVAAQPGSQYNPFVLVGPTGVGKTHLLHALGHALAAAPDAVVACVSTQQWLDEFAAAQDGGTVEAWRARYRRATALLMDDLQLLAGRREAQEEFFHLFNGFLEAGRQVAGTLTHAPKETRDLDDRLLSRLEGGLVTDMGAPDRELRRSVVVRKLEEQFGAIEEELADYLAARPAESVRAVLGMVQRLTSAAESRGAAPTAALARELIEGAAPARTRQSMAVQTSGIVASPLGGLRSREKVVWHWPDPADRVIEDLG